MNARLGIGALMLLAVAAACHRQPQVRRVLPGVSSGNLSELSESSLAAMVICHDTLGRPDGGMHRKVAVMRCTPCISYGMQTSASRTVAYARRMWLQGARAPFDTFDMGANCTRLAYKYARALRPNDDSLAVEIALVDLNDERDSLRAVALHTIDSLVDERLAKGLKPQAANIVSQLAMGIFDRAQRQVERPSAVDEHRLERRVHRLAEGAPRLTRLPPIPRTSRALGVSEAEWAARLFDTAAQLEADPSTRSRLLRLTLAPWVMLEDWVALDSAASALLARIPNDSAVLPARALAAYRTIKRPVPESPRVMALFDSVVAHLPRADSLRYDSFDGVLTASDDEWRYGFLPDVRFALELRGWSVLDPLWSTPVNEVRLARRARVAEADYRYADIARAGESGSETRPGQILLRRGAPSPRWTVTSARSDRMWMERTWRGLTATAELDVANQEWNGPQTWRTFYGSNFTPLAASLHVAEATVDYLTNTARHIEPCIGLDNPIPTLYSCAIFQRSDWSDVPFYGRSRGIDVTVARFRARGDSADMYIGARIPLLGFKTRGAENASRTDRITIGAWLTSETGAPIAHDSVSRELPTESALAYTHQWTYRVGSTRMMHRVEAMEPTAPSGARGIARFTSDAQVAFPLRGFGMSDVLIAGSAKPRSRAARRWNDLDLQPNGASVAPGARFAMIWEVYDLTPDRNGRVRWRVRIKRERGAMVIHDDMKDVLAGSARAGTRVLANESSAPDMAYVRDAAGGAPVLDNVMFGLDDAPEGQHVVNVTIDDLVSGKSVTRGVSVRVVTARSLERGR